MKVQSTGELIYKLRYHITSLVPKSVLFRLQFKNEIVNEEHIWCPFKCIGFERHEVRGIDILLQPRVGRSNNMSHPIFEYVVVLITSSYSMDVYFYICLL